jgi:hypothetical protein
MNVRSSPYESSLGRGSLSVPVESCSEGLGKRGVRIVESGGSSPLYVCTVWMEVDERVLSIWPVWVLRVTRYSHVK